jgi:NAD(P)-dependent dehydrogenase (short-subunit alcohol dehydrogenase family)
MPTAVITGASWGLGRALATRLTLDGWTAITTARGADDLERAIAEMGKGAVAVAGDVNDPDHLQSLARMAEGRGPVDLLVNNASALGPSPLPSLGELDPQEFEELLRTNLVAPLAVFQAVRPHLANGAVVLNVTSDASVEAYEGWGGYGASKAGLDHLSAVLAVEEPSLRVYAVDPGDMRTRMHQAAFPGEDISDRPAPEDIVPSILRLLELRPPSGRLRAADFAPVPS